MSESGPGRREVAYRLFAAEFDDSELSYSESDEERAPNYVVTPTGARVNRLFAVGVLTELEDVNPEMVRGRIVDPTGAFVTYAGQYQPDALAFLDRAEPPAFLSLSGKARTYEPEDGDQIFTSVRPESVSEVDAETRDRWIVTAAERTVERIGIAASAIESGLSGGELEAALLAAGVDDRLAEGVPLALDHYGTTPAYLEALRELAIDAVRVVVGEREEVGLLELAPDEGTGDASALSTLDLSVVDTPSTPTGEARPPDEGDVSTEDRGAESAEDEIETSDVSSTGEGVDSVEEGAGVVEEETAGEPSAVDSESAEPSATDTERAEPIETTTDLDPIDSSDGSTADGVEASTAEPEPEEPADGDPEDFDPGEFELDEEERREVEEEFGTEFSTAGEVEPADADPGPDDGTAIGTDGEGGSEASTEQSEAESGTEAEPEADTEPEPEATENEDVDLTDAVMEAMERLDDGDGAQKGTLVSTVSDERGVASEDIEEAIQEALMSGRCYEPSDGMLKSI